MLLVAVVSCRAGRIRCSGGGLFSRGIGVVDRDEFA